MKKYSIISAYSFNDKKTGEKKYLVAWLLQTTAFPVTDTRKFFFTEKEFESLFAQYILEEEAEFGLKGLFLIANENFSVEE